MEKFGAYIPIDRRHALARNKSLPDRTRGAALFADISGFTPLTEALAKELGPRRGAEELTHQLNRVYTALVSNVHLYQGSVIGFAGDAITCWFEYDKGLRAISCALAMQSDMARLGNITTPGGKPVELAIKTAVATGDVRRFLIGDPGIQRMDILAGDTLARMADAEHMAERGDVVITEPVMQANKGKLKISTTRTGEDGRLYGVVEDILSPITLPPWPSLARELSDEEMQEWLLPPVYRHLAATEGGFLAELRPAATIFMYFDGIDYDGDDDAGDQLDLYISWVQNVLKKYEGSLLQLIMGDKGSYLYAAFGAPISYGDDQARAVAAGLELRHPPEELSYIQNTKIGVSHGRMRTGAYGGETRMTYGVLGDEVNTSARLMQKAAVGQVMVSPQIEEAVRSQYDLNSLGEIELKGKADPLPVFEVTGLREEIPTISERTEYVILGRDETLAEMEEILDRAVAGKGQILRAEGPAGIGKSHLAYEFNRRARNKGARLYSGACQSTTQATPYYPWRQIFRNLFDVSMRSKGSTNINSHLQWQIEIVTAQVMTMNPDWWLRLPLLGDLLGLPIVDNAATAAFDPRLRQEALFTLAVEIIQHKAAEQPLVIYVDDIHWMDEASAELTIALARALSNHPVLLLFMHRPPINRDKPIIPALNELEHHHWLDLAELPPAAVAALAEVKLGAPIAPLAAEIIQSQAQGNPFFTEELVNSLREGGQLVLTERRQGEQWELADHLFTSLLEASCLIKRDGEWRLKDEVSFSASDLGLPDSIHGIVLSRLDRLSEGEKLTVKVASVVGRLFEFDLLRDIHPSDPEPASLMAQVLGIETRDFVQVEAPDPRLTYMFKHGTTQEVAYDTLLFAQRRDLHQTIGSWFENNFAGTAEPDDDGATKDDPLAPFYPLLAYHWRYAENVEKELHYSILAGEQAAAQFANEDALRFFGRALELAAEDDLETRYRVLLGREAIYDLTGQRDPQADDIQSLCQIASKTKMPSLIVTAGLRNAKYFEAVSDFEESEQEARKARKLATQHSMNELAIEASTDLGKALVRKGNLTEAKKILATTLEQARKSNLKEIEAKILISLGIVHFFGGDKKQAEIHYEQALKAHEETGDLKSQATTTTNLAGVHFQNGEYVTSQKLIEQGVDIYRKIGDRRGETRTLSNLGSIYTALGQLDSALNAHKNALNNYQAIGDRGGESLSYYNLSLVSQALEDYTTAVKHSKNAFDLDLLIGDKFGESYSKTAMALSYEGMKNHSDAQQYFEEAYHLKIELKQNAGALDNLAGLIRIALIVEDNPSFHKWLSEAESILKEISIQSLEHPVKIALTMYDAYQKQGQNREGRQYINQAYQLVQKRMKQLENAKNKELYRSLPDNKRLIQLIKKEQGIE